MTYLALTLVLSAALCHATWNLLLKKIDGGPELVWLFSVISVVLYMPLAIAVYVIQEPVLGPTEIGFCIVSALLHMAYFLLLQQGYRKGDLSLVYPTARATGPFLSTVFAVVILDEYLTLPIVIGGLAIVVGVIFLTGGFRKTASSMKTSLAFGLGTGLLIGCYTAWDAYTVSILLVPPLLLDYTTSLMRVALLTPYSLSRQEAVRRHWREHKVAVLIIAVFNSLAYILVLTALTFTPVVYVAPAREVSVLITVIMGAVLLGEGQLRQRMGWACLIVFGMMLLSLG